MILRKNEIFVHEKSLALRSNGWKRRGVAFSSGIGLLRMGSESDDRISVRLDDGAGRMVGEGRSETFHIDVWEGGLRGWETFLQSELMDELVVTAVSMLENERRSAPSDSRGVCR